MKNPPGRSREDEDGLQVLGMRDRARRYAWQDSQRAQGWPGHDLRDLEGCA